MPEAGIRLEGPVFRSHKPTYSYLPLSGDGAARYGGRFSERGRAALYLAGDQITAILESTQGQRPMPPRTLIEYHLDCSDILDARRNDPLTLAALKAAGIDPTTTTETELGGFAWEIIDAEGGRPKSWDLAERLIGAGYAGVVFPSYLAETAHDAWNVVLWDWAFTGAHRIIPNDPMGDLPKDASSWNPLGQTLPHTEGSSDG